MDNGKGADDAAKTIGTHWVRRAMCVALAAAALLALLIALALVVVDAELAAKKWDAVDLGR